LVQSFDFRVLKALEALAPEMPRAALFALRKEDFVSIARRTGVRIVSPEFHLITARRVAAARAAGIDVITWTPNRPRQWRKLIQAGVRAIITDDPAALIAYLNE
ncbi:MAG: glycerophosphodiester phosphodiesterase, partial [Acidobacteriia bacterium]|nr:glycerophosphodiester phosphodiesterase [Terriglobia bacterium]